MVADDRYCYFPSGNLAAGNVPCSDDTSATCCGSGDICLSNGLCLNVAHQPYVLSRGACTNSDWQAGCSSYCSSSTPSMGASIINLSFYNNTAIYCCGTPIIDGDTIVCPDSPTSGFEVPTGTPILGRALLANSTLLDAVVKTSSSATYTATAAATATSSSSSSATCRTCHQTEIGAGVGVALGVIALLSIIWALLERRRALKRQTMPPAAGTPYGGPYMNLRDRSNRPVELGNVPQAHELPNSVESPSEIMSKTAP
ncbi:uncharacterized protein N7482_006209 [Penicillium canariense]|uniref:Uncharacterized protein n=1 Tax=Penicillium canariense TaxID=189055 RepID=A0A9W9I619_9EURO|nr:uncharacterized protein N7482_006209 [Penicillium canariense]KAJ5167428.1 hypothetical protein N7482_006209 [Penicillium canariense]